jgi:glycosyltransferase involved in cell wall biosynthesis
VAVRPLPLRWLTPLCDRGFATCGALFGRADLYHTGPLLVPRSPAAPLVATVWDLTPIRFPDLHLPSNLFDRAGLRRRLERAARVIVPSSATAADLEAEIGVPRAKIRVVPLAADGRFGPPRGDAEREAGRRALEELGLGRDYVLTVAALEPRKNLLRLLEAFRLLRRRGRVPHQLAVVGPKGWMTGPLEAVLSSAELAGAVVATGYVPLDVLKVLYGNAALLVYPSLYEGFGLPPLEAMACGCPVAVSRSSSLPEVVGDAGLYFDPGDVEAIAGAMHRLLDSPELGRRLALLGLARSRAFAWERTARETLAVYREAAGAVG